MVAPPAHQPDHTERRRHDHIPASIVAYWGGCRPGRGGNKLIDFRSLLFVTGRIDYAQGYKRYGPGNLPPLPIRPCWRHPRWSVMEIIDLVNRYGDFFYGIVAAWTF